jgi:hypothetical protein
MYSFGKGSDLLINLDQQLVMPGVSSIFFVFLDSKVVVDLENAPSRKFKDYYVAVSSLFFGASFL